jgi:hypothetical protein
MVDLDLLTIKCISKYWIKSLALSSDELLLRREEKDA